MKGRKLLMIPGPVEYEPDVLAAMAEPTDSHVSKDFIGSFGRALGMLKEVFLSTTGQPIVVAGSGTLAMEMAVVNLAEPGDKVLVVSAGYFGDRFRDILARYEIEVTLLKAPIGEIPALEAIESSLRAQHHKLMTVTHVDTSTGVRSDVKELSRIARQMGTLVVVDGVAAAAAEEMMQDDWGVDVYFSASQKAIGVPPGLALLVVGPQAVAATRGRKTPVRSYYADFANWLPIMDYYQRGEPSYFATPAVNLVRSLEVSLGHILSEGMKARFVRHRRLAAAFRAAVSALGLTLVAARDDIAANTLSAVYFPDGVDAGMLDEVKRRGVILAGGLVPEIKGHYFRVGHMGSVDQGDLLATIGAIEGGLKASNYRFEVGSGLQAAQRILLE